MSTYPLLCIEAAMYFLDDQVPYSEATQRSRHTKSSRLMFN
jgi:hypothetical protein